MSDWVEGAPPRVGRFYPAGTLLQLHSEHPQTRGHFILVGHANDLGGICDDCTVEIDPEDIAYHRVLWREGED